MLATSCHLCLASVLASLLYSWSALGQHTCRTDKNGWYGLRTRLKYCCVILLYVWYVAIGRWLHKADSLVSTCTSRTPNRYFILYQTFILNSLVSRSSPSFLSFPLRLSGLQATGSWARACERGYTLAMRFNFTAVVKNYTTMLS